MCGCLLIFDQSQNVSSALLIDKGKMLGSMKDVATLVYFLSYINGVYVLPENICIICTPAS